VTTSSLLNDRFWWPLDLSPREEFAFYQFRERMGETVALNASLVEQTARELSLLMGRHISDLCDYDSLPHFNHILNGWGNVRIEDKRITDRIERFIHKGPTGLPYIIQCHLEGEVHPWQTLAYAAMAGVNPDTPIGSTTLTIRDIAQHTRQLNTSEGRELGHLLFALTYMDPEMHGGPFFLLEDACDLDRLMRRAVEAHHFGTFDVCRKFHLTEGICAVASTIKGFEEYLDAAQGFLEGQLDQLFLLGLILSEANEAIEAKKQIEPDSLIPELRDQMVLGPFLENHCYYAGHIIELAMFAESFSYAISPEQRNVMAFVVNELNKTLRHYLRFVAFEQCFLHLGHYRRAMTLLHLSEQRERRDAPFSQEELRRYTAEFEESVERSRVTANTPIDSALLDVYQLDTSPSVPRPKFEAIIDAYKKIALPHFEVRGKDDNYRRLGPPWWPRAFHYELIDYREQVGVEIHLESDEVSPFAPTLRSLLERVSTRLSNQGSEWDPAWFEGRGRLRVFFSTDLAPETVATCVLAVINETFPTLDLAVKASSRHHISTPRKLPA